MTLRPPPRLPASASAPWAALALAGLALALGGCTSQAPAHRARAAGTKLTIYSSLPLRGPFSGQARDVIAGERLALERARASAGGVPIRYVSLDDTARGAVTWDPAQVATNARLAAGDPTTIAYLGELDTGASAISIPILNGAGILQVSPGDTFAGLTRSEGAGTDEPQKYYPTGRRTFARVVPNDDEQAAALLEYMRVQRVRRLYIVDDSGPYGHAIAARVVRAAGEHGVKVVGAQSLQGTVTDFRPVARTIRVAGARGLLFTGTRQNEALGLWRVVARRRRIKLFVPAALGRPGLADGIERGARRAFLTSPVLPATFLDGAAGRFERAFRSRYGRRPGPWAVYGYEAMSVVLQAIDGTGRRARDRRAVIARLFAIPARRSPLGPYSIDVHGDTTRTDFGGYRIHDGRFVFDRVLSAPPEP